MSHGIEFVRKWDTTGDPVRFRVRLDGNDYDGRISHNALLYLSGDDPLSVDYNRAFSENLQRILEIAGRVIQKNAADVVEFRISESDVRR
ncbi:DUF1488 family protein [Burkholderia pyrrocinia]|uniref:DUF1488 family protein n=1 Tax=Burkholderia pyrrocinia TaxID=60550 RepID=UPI000DEEC203